MMYKDLKELLLAFNAHGVKYLVVGGYAVGVHAEPRATPIGATTLHAHGLLRASHREQGPALQANLRLRTQFLPART